MNGNRRVVHVKRGFTLKFKQALKAIENHSVAWVEYGVSIRDLTIAESIASRNKAASEQEPLALAEIHGVTFDPPVNQIAGNRREQQLVYEVNSTASKVKAWAEHNKVAMPDTWDEYKRITEMVQ